MTTTIETPDLIVPVEIADQYFSLRLRSDAWQTATPEQKTQALTWAGRIIQYAYSWDKAAFTSVGWALPVQFAVCEQALWVLKRDPTEYPEILTRGIVEGKAQPVSAKFSKDFIVPLVCLPAKALVGDLGTLLTDGYGTLKSSMLETL